MPVYSAWGETSKNELCVWGGGSESFILNNNMSNTFTPIMKYIRNLKYRHISKVCPCQQRFLTMSFTFHFAILVFNLYCNVHSCFN